ncbi:MAG: UDP-N-acetylglucosamine 2-epimerase (hydrolyzing) [Anaerolineae bacterium]|nr:UDP-N-acetylglucosamine 2-epimerase (hydrolyzing) [Phycisphaerae bacterium]
MKRSPRRRVCFVTGTRAEFGLMESTLRAIAAHPKLSLQIIATGMHLDRRRGSSKRQITERGFKIDHIVRWPSSKHVARSTGRAMADLADALDELKCDIVLVVGDRVEAFAAASAAHISGRIVAHVHGGDRALGQVDDSLRHAITKLAHLHFPATRLSAQRIIKLGEDRWRVHQVGSPGIDGIALAATTKRRPRDYVLLVLHPISADVQLERRQARMILKAIRHAGSDRIVIVYPNNDPGGDGIIRAWEEQPAGSVTAFRNLSRADFLGLLRDAAVLVGNSSSGIIEAASFGTPVVDIGPRQQGRERGANVVNVAYSGQAIEQAVRRAISRPRPVSRNVYGGRETSQRIASVLAGVAIDSRLRRKLIAY